ncbi:MAG: winged helix-turn-helix transcriptional regulator [Chloroflexi bacterium]|nr:MAG: winged helix-turn-helix transcriptional regulator [Chloroflexota bacterium]
MTAPTLRPDRLLEGEDSRTLFARDARHWIGVYQQMIGFKEDLLGRIRTQLAHLPAVARADVVENDINALEDQLLRYRRRLEFCYSRQWQLEGLQIDHDGRTLTYRERVISLTKREFQLLVFLVGRSPNFVSPTRLLVEAWHDGNLPEETLRTYIARLRTKIVSLGVRAAIKNKPRAGYAIVFVEQAPISVDGLGPISLDGAGLMSLDGADGADGHGMEG